MFFIPVLTYRYRYLHSTYFLNTCTPTIPTHLLVQKDRFEDFPCQVEGEEEEMQEDETIENFEDRVLNKRAAQLHRYSTVLVLLPTLFCCLCRPLRGLGTVYCTCSYLYNQELACPVGRAR